MVIIPNAFRIELIKIAIRKIGAIHLIMTVNIFLAFECAVIRSFYFINDGLRLDHESYEDASQYGNDRHQHTVTDEVHSIQNGHSQRLDKVKCSKSEGSRNSNQQ